MKDVGEPCAGEPHARFDGRGLETERSCVTAPVPDPTNLEMPQPVRCRGERTRALNYRERRLLAELARQLQMGNPGLVRQLRQPRTVASLPRWIFDLVLKRGVAADRA